MRGRERLDVHPPRAKEHVLVCSGTALNVPAGTTGPPHRIYLFETVSIGELGRPVSKGCGPVCLLGCGWIGALGGVRGGLGALGFGIGESVPITTPDLAGRRG